jgi:hypothetical protein
MSLVRIQSPRPTFAHDRQHSRELRLAGRAQQMTAVPIRYRRAQKGLFAQKLQHAIPSIVVLSDGISHLSHAAVALDLWLGIAEVGVSALVIGSVIRGFRELRKTTAKTDHDVHPHHGVDWIDICLGVMLSVEAYAKYHATSHIPRPTILLAFTMLAIGVLHGKIAKKGDERRELRVGAAGISVPGRLFSRLTLEWQEVASIDVDDRSAVISALDGRTKRIDLGDVFEPNAVRTALASARTYLEEARHAAGASIESTTADA